MNDDMCDFCGQTGIEIDSTVGGFTVCEDCLEKMDDTDVEIANERYFAGEDDVFEGLGSIPVRMTS